jgi:hypothetical protein
MLAAVVDTAAAKAVAVAMMIVDKVAVRAADPKVAVATAAAIKVVAKAAIRAAEPLHAIWMMKSRSKPPILELYYELTNSESVL